MSSLNLKSSHTARAVSEHQLRGINRQVKLSVIIEGRVISLPAFKPGAVQPYPSSF